MTARPVSRDEAISLGRIDPAASAYGAHLRRKGILRPMPEPVALLRRLLAPASEPSADAPRLIRAGRVLSDGCGR
jgi:hypothetical protein